MPRLIWSPAALRDVQRLHRYLAERNTDAARRTVKAIRNGVKMLQHQPAVGRPVDDIEPGYREWMIDFGDGGYVRRCTGSMAIWSQCSRCAINGKPATERPGAASRCAVHALTG